MRRNWTRPNTEWPEHMDSFVIETRSVKAGTKVTMYELNRSNLGGPLDKTVVVWPTHGNAQAFIDMLDAINAIGKDLEADGWEYDIPPKHRRKRAQ